MNKLRIVFLLLFLLGAGIRAVDLWRPVDGTVRESWRECDIAAVARNFHHEGMNILYPRIDWRGDGPGFAEMEFPIYPWTIAVLYKTFGFHEEIGRVLSYGFSLASMLVFIKLVRYLLPPAGAIGALLFLVLSPLAVRISNGLQPEGLMFLCYITAAYAFIRWIDEQRPRYYWMALGSTALAILAKANAAHIGLFFAAVLLTEKGFGELESGRVVIFAILSLLPGALWYHHAHNLYLTYGNSLGVSNEYHWIGWDFFTNPRFIVGIGKLETIYVWMPAGLVVAAIGVVFRWRRREVRLGVYWIASIIIYYVITSRTSSEDWATYYHLVSVPPAAMLMGSGLEVLKAVSERFNSRKPGWIMVTAVFILAFLGGLLVRSKVFAASALVIFTIFVLWTSFSQTHGKQSPGMVKEKRSSGTISFGGFFLACILAFATFLYQARIIYWDVMPNHMQGKFECAKNFKPHIPENTLIAASGGARNDEDGYPVAYNASYFFYWLDRKGFNVCREDQSVEKLRLFATKGARFFVGEKSEMDRMPGFESDARNSFKVLAECKDVILFDLGRR